MTVTAPRTAREEELHFCGLDGQYLRHVVLGERWPGGGGAHAQVRLVQFADGQWRVQKAIPVAAGRQAPVLYDRLENEIRSGVRLAERYRRAYPPELLRLVGYNFDAEVPYMLFDQPRGKPVGDQAGKLLLDEQKDFAAGLLRALQLLSEAGVVHDGLHPGAVYWDGANVQLFDFGLSAMTGEPARETAAAPWAAPERRVPGGTAAVSDDVWSAGMIIYHVVTGRHAMQVADVPDLDVRGGLRRLLEGVFTPSPQLRPTVADLLVRARAGGVAPVADPMARAGFQTGLAVFDEVRASKHGPAPALVTAVVPAPPKRRGALPWLLLLLLLAVAGVAAFFATNGG